VGFGYIGETTGVGGDKDVFHTLGWERGGEVIPIPKEKNIQCLQMKKRN
jgi:hypothetical protein